jgi:hypothetical protein
MPAITCPGWRNDTRARAIDAFRLAWERAPAAGRAALLDAAARDAVGHRWETGRHACVLALLVMPALKPGEPVKAGAYRLFGWEVTEDFPATWDAGGVTLAELLAAVGVRLPRRAGRTGLRSRPVGVMGS